MKRTVTNSKESR